MRAIIFALLLSGCASKPQCVARDLSAPPTFVTVFVSGMVVTQPVYPCAQWQ